MEPALKEILEDKDADLRRSAVFALGQIGRKNPANKKAIIKKLDTVMNDKSETVDVRWMAATVLMKMGNNCSLLPLIFRSLQTIAVFHPALGPLKDALIPMRPGVYFFMLTEGKVVDMSYFNRFVIY